MQNGRRRRAGVSASLRAGSVTVNCRCPAGVPRGGSPSAPQAHRSQRGWKLRCAAQRADACMAYARRLREPTFHVAACQHMLYARVWHGQGLTAVHCTGRIPNWKCHAGMNLLQIIPGNMPGPRLLMHEVRTDRARFVHCPRMVMLQHRKKTAARVPKRMYACYLLSTHGTWGERIA